MEFEAGTYPLKTFVEAETDQTGHDAGAEPQPVKEVHILMKNFQNICVSGKTDQNGNPATILTGLNTGKLHELLPSILWVDGGKNITIENLKFKRDPEYASAGRVETVINDTITLRVFDGNPCYDTILFHFIRVQKLIFSASLAISPICILKIFGHPIPMVLRIFRFIFTI